MEERANKVILKDLNRQQLADLLVSWGEKPFRAQQIRQWMFTHFVDEFSEMNNLSYSLQRHLEENTILNVVTVESVQNSALENTKKYLFKLDDEQFVEGVVMDYRYGNTACLSTQVGCRMGCHFCASTLGGLVRNLTAGEIVDQLVVMSRDLKKEGQKIGRIVLMGTGEPLDNLDEVKKFLHFVHEPDCFHISYRKMTISTCGLVPEILQLSEEEIPINLAISLHAPTDKLRNQLMPVNRLYPLDQLINACRIYVEKTKRRITFEYTLIEGVNDSKQCAIQLSNLLSGLLCHVNLIPLNPVQERTYRRSSGEMIDVFKQILAARGINATIRRELGLDINAACGQLRRTRGES